jgi:hypothetical protein
MATVIIALVLAQEPGCAAVAAARARADAFDLSGAMQQLQAAVKARCSAAQIQDAYLRGWIAARDAYRAGGSPDSLKEVETAIAFLNRSGEKVAVYVLQAAEAAAQSERETLALFIDQAVQLESVRLSAGQPPAPIITAHEAAGDLWLQVHRYEDARRAYLRAAERVGTTPRITLGLARVAARLKDFNEACRQYAALAAAWKDPRRQPLEIGEAIRFPQDVRCPPSGR